jgi:hypothetical protein
MGFEFMGGWRRVRFLYIMGKRQSYQSNNSSTKGKPGKPQPNFVDQHKEKDLRPGEERGHGAGSGSRRDGVSESRGHGGECRSTGSKKGGGEEELHFDYYYFLVLLKENRNYVVNSSGSPILFSLSFVARMTRTTKNR